VTRLRQSEARNDLTVMLHRAARLGLGRRARTATGHCTRLEGFVTTGVNVVKTLVGDLLS
jgi:hypothetical protein